ncbi:MAG: hypothetical protein Kow0042_18860 [Calditrichia bacterium]
MDSEHIKKIEIFLRAYRDLYGDNLWINSKRLQEQLEEFLNIKGLEPILTAEPEIPRKPKPVEKKESPLWRFRQQIMNCTKCPLGHTRTNFVFGVGNENADIMFIGEAPGAEEDRQGIPFVGKAGKLLDKLLARVHLKREEVFIANILKCRPPNNRDPEPEEVRQCIPYLHQQIEMIQPKIIVALGRVAAQNLLGKPYSLRDMRGRRWQYQNVDMIVTYHPAAILRNAGYMDSTVEDLKFVVEIYKEKLKRIK